MAQIPTFELVTPTSSQKIGLGQKLGSGGAGTVYQLQGDPSVVVKIYHDTISAKDLANSERQVKAMVLEPPDLPPFQYQGRSYTQIAWPKALLLKNGKFVGFSMPALELSRTKELEYLLMDKQAAIHGLRSDMGTRVTVARQLAGVVAALHAKGHYVIDMKPLNLSYYPDTLYMAVLDCDGFNIHDEATGANYPAPMFTPEYLAPEFQNAGGNPNSDPKAQDKFALAVVIFQLLCHGVHPYSGVLRRQANLEVPERISRGYFPYGRTPNPQCDPNPFCTYRCLPSELLECFERAFGSDSARRPSSQEWTTRLEKYANPSTNNLIVCKVNPKHRHFAGLPCSQCARENRTVQNSAPQRPAPRPAISAQSAQVSAPTPGSATPAKARPASMPVSARSSSPVAAPRASQPSPPQPQSPPQPPPKEVSAWKGLAIAVVVVFAMMGAMSFFDIQLPTSKPAPAITTSGSTTGSPIASAVAISAVTLGSTLVNGRISVPKNTFARTDTIYATVAASSATANVPIVLHWTYGDAKQLVRDENQTLVSGQSLTTASIAKPDGWPLGNYSLDVVVNGQTISSTRFNVSANAPSSTAQADTQSAMREKCMPQIKNVFDSITVGSVCDYKLKGFDDSASFISAFPAECKGVLSEDDLELLSNNSATEIGGLEKKLGHETLCLRAMNTGMFIEKPNSTANSPVSSESQAPAIATPENNPTPQPLVALPDIRVGAAYTYESTTTDSDGKVSSSMSTRQVVAVNGNHVTVSFSSGAGKPSTLIYDRQWNFVESGDTADAGLVYNPPIKYFDFPLAPGKKWSAVSTETNKKTGKTRQFTINAEVVGWDSNIGTLDGHAVDGLKIKEDTSVDDDGTRTTGTDISWYVPSLGRSVYSKITGQFADGKQDFKTLRLVNFTPGNIIAQVPSAPSTVAAANQQTAQPATETSAESPRVQPSFDCTRASTAAEVSICVNPELAKLDNQLGLAYGDLIGRVPASSMRQYRTDESGWVKARNERCGGNVECLRGMLQNRIAYLKQTTANALTVPSPSQPEREQGVAGTPPVSVDSIAFGHSASANGEIRRPDTKFSPTDTIYVSIRSNVESTTPQTFDVLWSASDGTILKKDRMTLTTGPHLTLFNFSDYQGLPNGQYTVGVFVSGKLVSNNSFQIAPGFMDRLGNSLKGAVKVEVRHN